MMKKMTCWILVVMIALSTLGAEAQIMPIANPGDGKPVPVPAVAKFDINAYLSEPLEVDKVQVNIYDTISMRAGALGSIDADSIAAVENKYMGIDPYISDVLSTAGISLMTIDCTGKLAAGSKFKMNIGFEVLSIKTKDGSVPTGSPAVTGFQNTETDAQIPYRLTFKKDKSHNLEANVITNSLEVFNSGVSKTYVLNASVPGSQSDEWSFQGSLFMNIDRNVYDNSPMGKYRTLIKINIATGA